MNLQKFVELIEEQFEEAETGTFTSDTMFKDDDEWDSLTALSVISAIDEEMNITINSDDLEKANTIEDLFLLISKNSSK